ncbi:MAG: TraB/GumN family protein [Ignavibacteriales bacterium]|nr:MAG: TraB/GumN family protein [Ignavibacteriales bacterium]
MKNIHTKSVLPGIIFLFISINLFPQNYDESLLWEISDNGLTKPSYLYGTIHVQDKRVFELHDSVVIAIENCDAFAGELNMDSVYLQVMNYLAEIKYTGKSLEELLTKEEYEKLNKKSEKILGLPLNEIPIKDPRIITIALEDGELNEDFDFTLDEYLYRIAKYNKLKITSVETLEDQLNVLNSMTEEIIRESLLKIINDESTDIEELIIAYSRNDLKLINEMMTGWDEDFPELANVILYDRNIKMAEEINNLVKRQTVFIAIGAGHLSGERGVISLLAEDGFKLRPVFSSNTEVSDKYSVESMELLWQIYSPSTGEFEIEMPGTPFPIPFPVVDPDVKIESGMCLDIAEKSVFIAIKYETLSDINEKADSILQDILGWITVNTDSLKIESIVSVDGSAGKQIQTEINGMNALVNYYVVDKKILMFIASVPDDSAGKKNAERFFRSFRLKKNNH